MDHAFAFACRCNTGVSTIGSHDGLDGDQDFPLGAFEIPLVSGGQQAVSQDRMFREFKRVLGFSMLFEVTRRCEEPPPATVSLYPLICGAGRNRHASAKGGSDIF